MTKHRYNPGATAIHRRTPSRPAKAITASPDLDLTSILDLGCGKGADLAHYQAYSDKLGLGAHIVGYDPHQKERLELPPVQPKFKTVAITYVLNVLPTFAKRFQCLIRARTYLAKGGHLVVTVRPKTEIEREAKKKDWPPVLDGYYSNYNKGMIQVGLSKDDIRNVARKARLVESETQLTIPGATCVVLEKEEDE